MKAIFHDLRYALRQLRRSPGFTLTAILTLAIGLGASAAVYSVIQRVLLSPLPYADPDRLVGVAFTFPHEKPNAEEAGSTADFIRLHSTAFSSLAVLDDSSPAVNLSINGGHAMQVSALGVSQGYLNTLGVSPALGRNFTADEDRPGAAPVAILSDGLWTSAFNSDPSIIGRAIRINQGEVTVVGIMPATFRANAETAPGVEATPDLWQPLQLGPKDPGYDGDNYEMIGRLRPGVTLQQAQQQLAALQAPFYAQNPAYKLWSSGNGVLHEFRIFKLQDVVVSDVRSSLLTVMGAVLAVLLVACLNLAGLMLARTMRRSRELALRTALGATRMQLLRLLGAEGLLLAAGGGLLALAMARVAAEVLLHSAPLAIPSLQAEPGLGLEALCVLGFALLSTSVFSALPAGFILNSRGREAKLGGATLGENASNARLSRALMVLQIAVAMALVSTASVLMGTFVKLRTIPSGVEPKQLTVFQVALKGQPYAKTQATMQFVSSVLEQLRHQPAVDRVAAINGLPLDRGLNMGGYPSDRQNLRQIVEFRPITAGYFETMGMHLLAGRDIDETDRAATDPVVVISATTAMKWWPGRSPIGESIRIGNERNWRIVGVVADAPMHSLVEAQDVVVYGPMAQLSDAFTAIVNGWFPTTFAVRTAAHINIAQVAQQAVTRADAEIPVARLTTMQAVIDSTLDQPRFFSLLAGSFSAIALALTVIGLFGLLSYQVAQRTREIGVRMALGANRAHILLTFLSRGMAIAAIGITVGLLATWLIQPVVSQLLLNAGVDSARTAQPVVFNGALAAAVSALVILIASISASWLPARRAASIEPMEALRSE